MNWQYWITLNINFSCTSIVTHFSFSVHLIPILIMFIKLFFFHSLDQVYQSVVMQFYLVFINIVIIMNWSMFFFSLKSWSSIHSEYWESRASVHSWYIEYVALKALLRYVSNQFFFLEHRSKDCFNEKEKENKTSIWKENGKKSVIKCACLR